MVVDTIAHDNVDARSIEGNVDDREGRSGIHHDPSLADDSMGGDHSVNPHRLPSC